jgi:hypothetical protein
LVSFLRWVRSSAPDFRSRFLDECIPLDNGVERCSGLYKVPGRSGPYYAHNGGVNCCGWRGMGSWITAFPFGIDGALMVNTAQTGEKRCGGDPSSRQCEKNEDCAGVDCLQRTDVPMIEDGEAILRDCFDLAVALVNDVPPNPD